MTTITLAGDTSAAPQMRVDVDNAPADADTLTAWRTAGGRESRVRGMVSIAADGASGVDAEWNPAWDSSYRVQFFDGSGDFLGWSDPVVYAGDASGSADVAWFHNPLDTSGAVRVEFRGQDNRALLRPVDAEILYPAGRSIGVAVFHGPRRGLSGVVLDCVTFSAEDEARFDALFGGYDDTSIPIICVRPHPATRLPPTLFAVVTSPSKLPVDGAAMGELLWWGLQGDEVAPPAEALVVALLSYADFTAFYSDYDAFTAAYVDYTAASRDYSIAGTA